MPSRILFSPTAEAELLAAARYIAQDAPFTAAKWYTGMRAAISSLREMPHRCPLARESEDLEEEVRYLIFTSYRILFSVEEDRVHIHRIVHMARADVRQID